ncbi:MAG: hypothetical protein QM771_17725 [Nitrospira sp.]
MNCLRLKWTMKFSVFKEGNRWDRGLFKACATLCTLSKSNKTTSVLSRVIFIIVILSCNLSERHSIAAAYEEIVSNQLLVVITPEWDATTGSLYRYSREGSDKEWHLVDQRIPIVVGGQGMGWGKGLHGEALGDGPAKKEGDGRSPAGVFPIEKGFGHALAKELSGIRLPYRPLTQTLLCIDDVSSALYNQIIEPDEHPGWDWNGTERMSRHYELYKWGLVIEHNAHPPISGSGSCIFLHVWRGPSVVTGGCTAMAAEHMEDIMKWIDPNSRPLIIQLPLPWYSRLHEAWHLPPPPYEFSSNNHSSPITR